MFCLLTPVFFNLFFLLYLLSFRLIHKVIELEDKLSTLESQLAQGKKMYNDLQAEFNEKMEVLQDLDEKLKRSGSRKADSKLEEQLAEERKAFLELEKK